MSARFKGPFPSFPKPLYQNEVNVEMIIHSNANKTHFHTKGCALGLILKVRIFGSQKWSICKRWLPSLNLFSVFFVIYIGDYVQAITFVTVIF